MDEVDRIRLEQFRQLKESIRGSEAYLIVGIDVGKEKHTAFIGTAKGKTILKRLSFGNDYEGFKKLLDQTNAAKEKGGFREIIYGLEPTANYHKPLADFLVQLGRQIVLVAVKGNRNSLDGRWDKHDTKDAANIADLISQGKFLYYEYPDFRLRELRELLALKRRLKRQEHSLRVRIRNHLVAKYFPELDAHFGHSEKLALAIVRWCLDPSLLAAYPFEEFLKLVVPGRCRLGQRERLWRIWETAKNSIGCDVGATAQYEAEVMVEGVRQVREAIAETDRQIQERASKFAEYEYLLSIPGFGPDVSSKVSGAIGDPFRFQNGRQVLKLAGWDLNAERSGKNSEGTQPVISKRGKADLRYALYQAALVASSRNYLIRVYFARKLQGRQREAGILTKMRVKLAAKLLIIAWTLMKKKEAFNPDSFA